MGTKVDGWNVHTIKINEVVYSIGYKLVDSDLKSLGLNRTPIVQYSTDNWVYSPRYGIWSARVPAVARWLKKHVETRKTDPKSPRLFVAVLDKVEQATKNGVKSRGILLLEEILDIEENFSVDNKHYGIHQSLLSHIIVE